MGDLLPTLSKIVPDGPPKIRAARKRLAAALGRITLPVASDYVQHAATEAAHTEVVAADLLDNDGAVRSTARAEEWRVGLEQLDADQRFLDDEERMIGDHLQPRCRSRPTRALHTARGYLATIETPENVAGMKDHIVLVKTAYNAARDDPACRLLEIPETDREVTMALKAFVVCSTGAGRAAELSGAIEQAVREGVVEPLIAEVHELVPDPLDLKGERLQHAFDLGKLLTAVAILVVLAFAGATVWDAAYEPKPAFADFSDYFTLYSAALASGAAAAVLGVLAYWRPAPATSPG